MIVIRCDLISEAEQFSRQLVGDAQTGKFRPSLHLDADRTPSAAWITRFPETPAHARHLRRSLRLVRRREPAELPPGRGAGAGGSDACRTCSGRGPTAARTGKSPSSKAVIQVVLSGGPSHMETYDPKPDAPDRVSRDVKAMSTCVPGDQRQRADAGHARAMDKMAILRSLTHETSDHFAGLALDPDRVRLDPAAAEPERAAEHRVGRGAGCRGRTGRACRRMSAMSGGAIFGGLFQGGSYLGPGYNPFNLDGDPSGDMKVRNLEPPEGPDARPAGGSQATCWPGSTRSTAAATSRARWTGWTSSRRRPTRWSPARRPPGPRPGARRPAAARPLRPDPDRPVLPAGPPAGRGGRHVRHDRRRELGPPRRRRRTAAASRSRRSTPPCRRLVEDLHDRGLAEQVLVRRLGRVRPDAAAQRLGRSRPLAGQHERDARRRRPAGWARSSAPPTARASSPTERALRPEDVIRTVYHVLGIDPRHEFPNESGRPMAVMNQGRPIAELISWAATLES